MFTKNTVDPLEPSRTVKRRPTVPIDPKLPPRFDKTPNDERPPSHQRWWNRPYIVTEVFTGTSDDARKNWLSAWPTGKRYDVRCLDGGSWDRSTWRGSFSTLDAALACARR